MSTSPRDWAAERPVCAIITGAGNGAGEMFARALSKRGVELLICDRDEIALARLRAETGATAVCCDVLDEQCVQRMFDAADDRFGHVDLLINAAGSGYVRTLGVMRTSREFARRQRAGTSYVVNLAGSPEQSDMPITYAGSEIAFNRLADGLARAIGAEDLKVLTIDRLDSEAAIVDLVRQLLAEIPNARNADPAAPQAPESDY